MSGDKLYSEKHMNQLDENNNILNFVVNTVHEKYKTSKDNRDARVLLEAINSSNESIHKQAANESRLAKAESNDKMADFAANILMSIAAKGSTRKATKIDASKTDIVIPLDLVAGELFIGSGTLDIDDIEKDD